jgi:hypothetical protein
MKNYFFILFVLLISHTGQAQERKEDVSKIIDDLTIKWDKEAVNLEQYEGLKQYCEDRSYRVSMVRLLNKIHHYDTVLYNTVKSKHLNDNDPEAKATLEDIDHVEVKYTTKNFLDFLYKECNKFNDVEENYGAKGGKKYEKQTATLEAEAAKYIITITKRIDLIDEHARHLVDL